MNRRLACGLLVAAAAASGCESDVAFTARAKPEQITSIAGTSAVHLYWEPVPGAAGYHIRDADTGDALMGTVLPETEEGIPFADGESSIRLVITARRGNAESDPSPVIEVFSQPDQLSPNPVWVASSFGLAFGSAIVSAGDVDDDGFEDVLIGAPATSGGGGVFLFRGRSAGLHLTPAWEETFAGTGGEFGASLARSDTYNDGETAWIVGAPGGKGRAYVYPYGGGATLGIPVPYDPPLEFEFSGFGRRVVAAGNLDGLVPRREEIAISAPAAAGGGRVFLYPGVTIEGNEDPPVGYSRVEVRLSPLEDGAELGAAMAPAGNLETDPADDLLLGAPGHLSIGGVAIAQGGPALFLSSALNISVEYLGEQVGERFGASVVPVGDPDEDDRAEFAVGAPLHDCDLDGLVPETGRIVIVNRDGSPEIVPEECKAEHEGLRVGTTLSDAGRVLNNLDQFLVGALDTSSGLGFFRLDQVTYGPPSEGEEPALSAGPIYNGDAALEPGVGRALATADVNGDGRPDILVGIPDRGPRGAVLLYVTLPDFGPQVHAGSLIETLGNVDVRLSTAFVSDSVGAEYDCTIDWGDDGIDVVPSCTPERLRAVTHQYPDAPQGVNVDYPVGVRAEATDGRSGFGLTRVRVTPGE